MTAGPTWAPPPNRWGAGRVIALVLGILLLLPAVGLLVGGGVLLWADRAERTDGYLFSSTGTVRSDGYAVTSDRIDLSTGADWVPLSAALGDARFEATGADGNADIFVGVASVADAAGYLGDVQRTVVDDLGAGSRYSDGVDRPGGAPSGPPGSQDFWVAQASGTGRQQLSWSPAQGDWMLVVMNADGSAGVDVQGRVGATVPALTGLAAGMLTVGVLLALVGVLMIVLAARRPAGRAAPPTGWGSASGPAVSGPPPGWAPPAPREGTSPNQAQPNRGEPGQGQPDPGDRTGPGPSSARPPG